MLGAKPTVLLIMRGIQRSLMIQDAQLMFGTEDVVRQYGSLIRWYSF